MSEFVIYSIKLHFSKLNAYALNGIYPQFRQSFPPYFKEWRRGVFLPTLSISAAAHFYTAAHISKNTYHKKMKSTAAHIILIIFIYSCRCCGRHITGAFIWIAVFKLFLMHMLLKNIQKLHISILINMCPRSTPSAFTAINMRRRTMALICIYCRAFCRFNSYAPPYVCPLLHVSHHTYF